MVLLYWVMKILATGIDYGSCVRKQIVIKTAGCGILSLDI